MKLDLRRSNYTENYTYVEELNVNMAERDA